MKNIRMKQMTEGSPAKLLIGFMVPLLLGLLFQQFYFMVDTMVVGKLLGSSALAGVGSTGPINFLVLGFCTGTCAGFSIPVAQRFGQQDFTVLKRVLGNMLWLSLILGTVSTGVVVLLCRQILIWMHTPVETFQFAYYYILIIFWGIPASMLYNTLSGIIRSLGNSRTPLLVLILSSIINIALDIILILWAHMGVAGAAVATVCSQLLSGFLCLAYIHRSYPMLHLEKDDLKLRGPECFQLLSNGLPMGLQYSITAIGCTMMQSSINGLGPAAMAAVTAGDRINGLLFCPTDAIGNAAATFAGQNIGAGKLKRVHDGTRANFLIGICYAVIALFLTFFFGKYILMLFLNPAEPHIEKILSLGSRYVFISAANLVFLLCVNLFRFSIQGMGFAHYAVAAGVMELIGRALFAVLIVPHFGFTAVCFASPFAWFMATLFLIPMYFGGLRILKKRFELAALRIRVTD